MTRLKRCLLAPVVATVCLVAGPAGAEKPANPLRFFEGRTESTGIVKLIARRPFKSHAIGRGEIKADGSLYLEQRVEEDDKPPFMRRWSIRKAGPATYTGTMTEAKGPVKIDEIGGRFRFRFKMKGGVNVEQWLTPSADWKSGRNTLTIKKFGLTVGTSEGTIRKLD